MQTFPLLAPNIFLYPTTYRCIIGNPPPTSHLLRLPRNGNIIYPDKQRILDPPLNDGERHPLPPVRPRRDVVVHRGDVEECGIGGEEKGGSEVRGEEGHEMEVMFMDTFLYQDVCRLTLS